MAMMEFLTKHADEFYKAADEMREIFRVAFAWACMIGATIFMIIVITTIFIEAARAIKERIQEREKSHGKEE